MSFLGLDVGGTKCRFEWWPRGCAAGAVGHVAGWLVLPEEAALACRWGAAVGLLVAVQLFVAAVLADLLAVNRRLHEESLTLLRELRYPSSQRDEEPPAP